MQRKVLGTSLILLCLAASPALAQSGHVHPGAASAKPAANDGWPATRAGTLASGWVAAFSAGETEMKEFLAKSMAPKSLATKGMKERVARYRDLREKYGRLELASVVKSRPGELTVKLMDAEASQHEFVFTVQTEAPFKLVSVGIKTAGHFGMGGHGGFGH